MAGIRHRDGRYSAVDAESSARWRDLNGILSATHRRSRSRRRQASCVSSHRRWL